MGAWRRMVAARGYSPTRRARGSVHTEDAVGRHRRKAKESSVVWPMSTDGCRKAKMTARESVKAEENQPDPADHKGAPAMGQHRWT